MKSKRPRILGAALLLATSLALPAAAQDRDIYIGASAGSSHFTNACDNLPSTCDNNDVAGRAFIGREFARYLSGEIAFMHFGKAKAEGIGEIRARAVDGSLLFMYPVDDGLSIFGRLGVYRVSIETEIFGTFESSRNSAWTYGLGAQYNIARALALRAEFQRYANAGKPNTGQQHLDFASLGLVVHF
jgi:opacity protein-like surface antigen